MENTHENPNQGTAQGADYSDVMTMFNDYETKSDDKPKQTKEDILAKYFTPRNGVEYFRILPPLKGRKIIESAFFHYVPVNKAVPSGKGFRKIYCPAHNSARVPKLDAQGIAIQDQNGKPVLVAEHCPLCEKAANIKKGLDTSIKYIKKDVMTPEQLIVREKNSVIYKAAGQWEARKYSIVRGIDRGKIKDGVKFWRFKDNFKNQGVLDKLVPALKLYHEDQDGKNPTDIEHGADLYINVVDSRLPNGQTYKDVSSITARQPSKLYDDHIVVNQWLGDQITWRDVFKEANMTKVLTSAEYLDRITRGVDPFWDDRDQENKRYVFPDVVDADLMAKANEKSESLDADSTKSYEMASDVGVANVVNDSYAVDITNVTAEDVGTHTDDAVDVGAQFTPTETTPPVQESVVQQTSQSTPASGEVDMESEDYDDLPF